MFDTGRAGAGKPLGRFIAAVLLLVGNLTVVTADVQLSGVDGELYRNVEAHLALFREPCDAPDWKIQRLYAEAEQKIEAALEVYGHYSPEIEKSLTRTGECWTASIAVDKGPAVRLRRVDIDVRGAAADDGLFRALLARNPLQAGLQLDHVAYERYKSEIAELGRRRGYFDGEFEVNRILVVPEDLAADVTLIYDSGERYVFGSVTIEQTVVQPGLVERYLEFEPGQPYEARFVSQLYEALLLTGYFDALDIRTEPAKEPERVVNITIRGSESAAQTYTTGIGFGTDTGPKFRAGYNNRRLNRAGHQFEAAVRVSPVISEAGLNYRLPLAKPTAEWLNFDTGYKYEDTDTSRSKTAKFGIKRLKMRTEHWLETQFIDIGYEDFTVARDRGTSFMLVPGISWSQATNSGPPRPRRGHRINLQVSGTVEQIGSSVSFLQGQIVGKIILPLWKSARILARAEGGYTLTSNFGDMPVSLRYFAGGDVSIRGYDFESLGPLNSNGEVIGGKNLLTGSVELDQRVAEKWSVAVFADAGNAFDDFDNIDAKVGLGTGIRWYSPVGPIRLDVAVPLADDAPDSFPNSHHAGAGPVMRIFAWLTAFAIAALGLALLAGLLAIGNATASAVDRPDRSRSRARFAARREYRGATCCRECLSAPCITNCRQVRISANKAAVGISWLELIDGRLVVSRLAGGGISRSNLSTTGRRRPMIRCRRSRHR